MADVIDHRGAQFPPPSRSVLLAVAKAIWVARTEYEREITGDRTRFAYFEQLNEEPVERLLLEARAAYCVLAIFGGGRLIELPEPAAEPSR